MVHTYYMYVCMYNLYISLHVCVCVLSIKCHFVTHSGYILILLLLDVFFVSNRWHFINRACIIHVFIFKHSIKDTANSYADKQQRTQYSFSISIGLWLRRQENANYKAHLTGKYSNVLVPITSKWHNI